MGYDILESYTDNIKVKISEKFKPPPRINLAMTYAQRLSLNKQTQDNMPKYEFALERTVLDKMKQWKAFRVQAAQERLAKLENLKIERKQKELEQLEQELDQEPLEEIELKTVTQTTNTGVLNRNFVSYSSSSDILIPTQVANNYTNILTPIPLQSQDNQKYNCKEVDKSPFNISDFENDTSSPFDNMELKSINDMEELAQVLNRDKSSYYTTQQSMYSGYQNAPPTTTTPQVNPVNYTGYLTNQYSYHIPNSSTCYQPQPSTRDYLQTNGYYYPPDRQQTVSTTQAHQYFKPPVQNYSYIGVTPLPSSSSVQESRKNCKSVPDIVRALEEELDNTHISEANLTPISRSIPAQTNRPKITDLIYPRPKVKAEELDPVYLKMSQHEKDLCKAISSMGFPLSRVARICQSLGTDQKKIVEHLLALSDLLDLGFPEKDVSQALIEYDNDRDKALDKLIS